MSTAPAAGSTSSPTHRLILGSLRKDGAADLADQDTVQAFLAAVLQSEHLNLLVGNGLTTALTLAAGVKPPTMSGVVSTGESDLDDALEAQALRSATASGRGTGNVEDRLRVALASVPGLRLSDAALGQKLAEAIDASLAQLHQSIVEAEKAIATSAAARRLVTLFLRSFAGRVPTRDRLHVFTTNYDRAIEWGAEQAGLRVLDRFVGTLSPIFRSSRLETDYHYSPPGTVREPRHLDGVIRLTKLHGSLDWRWSGKDVLRAPSPLGEASVKDPSEVLIYPNAAKDRETSDYPYADLFRDYSAALCRPNASLVTYGYGFGDDHINRVIRDMLTIPSTHVVVISYDDQTGLVEKFLADHEPSGQVSLLLGPGYSDLKALVESWLPWPASDALARAQVENLRATAPPAAPTSSGSVP